MVSLNVPRAIVRLALALATVLLAFPIGAGRAQTVRGRVVDSVTRRPLTDVTITLRLLAPDSAIASASSDATGSFSIAFPRPGNYYLAVRKIGYGNMSIPLPRLGPSDTRILEIRLLSLAVAMDTIVSRSSNTLFQITPGATWYARHFAEGKGMFISGLEIEQTHRAACDFFASLPGLSLVTTPKAVHAGVICSRPLGDAAWMERVKPGAMLTSRHASRCLITQVDHLFTIAYLDSADLYIRRVEGFGEPYQIPLTAIKAVEVYLNRDELPRDFSVAMEIRQGCIWMQVWTTMAW